MRNTEKPRLLMKRLRSLAEGLPMQATPGKDDTPLSAIEIIEAKWQTFCDEGTAAARHSHLLTATYNDGGRPTERLALHT